MQLAKIVLITVSFIGIDTTARAGDRPQYNRDIRPILAENCFACHGPDKSSRKAGLRLDRPEDSAVVIVPGQADKSPLVERIFSTDRGHVMPPPRSHKKLRDDQKETLKQWINAGAEYQPHWSLIAPQRPALPAVKDTAWLRNAIDRFTLAELEKRGLHPAPEADRRTLARRVCLDLTGLPPTLEEVESFVNDQTPDAYERYVDALMRSPHWGEHRGRYWLDAARYADTHGIHMDFYREIWAYRDWVIRAFNRNMPFDQFTLEQLAGDLLPNRTVDQQVASGFNRCNITTNEGGAIGEEYLVLYTRDRTETTAKVWLGLTMNCAVCHDHKFDPITQKDFYSLAAFFNNTTQGAMDGNIKDTPPVISVPRMEDRPRWEAVNRELAETKSQLMARRQSARAEFDIWLNGSKPEAIRASLPNQEIRLHLPLNEGSGGVAHYTVGSARRSVTVKEGIAWDVGHVAANAYKSTPAGTIVIDDAGDFDTRQEFSFGCWVKLNKRVQSGALFARMDDRHDYRGWDLWLEDSRVGTHIIHKWQEDALKVVANSPLTTGQWNHLLVTYDGSAKAGGVKIYINGQVQEMTVMADGLKNSIRAAVPFKIAQRDSSSRLDGVLVQDVRLYGRMLSASEVDQLAKGTRAMAVAARPADKRSPAEKNELFDWWLTGIDQPYQSLAVRLRALVQEEQTLRNRGTIAHVMQERPEEPTAFILYRGDYDKRREKVGPATPKSLPAMPTDLPRNRLGLAKWLLRSDHPLTARVTVNRFWQELFGTGIVRTSEDFGITGDEPTHPELLDWLAVEFRESGWDIKRFFKLLVTSSTYRQAAVTTPDKLEKDPLNRYLSRGPRYRMDAEMIRDYALAASGLLVENVGGPSVKPYQPEGVWEAVTMIGSDTRDYRRDNGNRLYRRSMYTFWKRAAPPASMEIFNAPSRETCTVRRERTDTPLQALVTLNDPQFIEAARCLAQGALQSKAPMGKMPADGIDLMARRLLARPWRTEERTVVERTLKDLLDYYRTHPEDAEKLIHVGDSRPNGKVDTATLAGWTMLANQLMNLDEVLNK